MQRSQVDFVGENLLLSTLRHSYFHRSTPLQQLAIQAYLLPIAEMLPSRRSKQAGTQLLQSDTRKLILQPKIYNAVPACHFDASCTPSHPNPTPHDTTVHVINIQGLQRP